MGRIARTIEKTVLKWFADDCLRMGAALSYYTIFAMVPFLLLTITFIGFTFRKEAGLSQIIAQLQLLAGEQAAAAVQEIVKVAPSSRSVGMVGWLLSFSILIFAASGIMLELKTALNKIWAVKKTSDFFWFVKKRLKSAAMVLGMGSLFIFSITLSTAVAAFERHIEDIVTIPTWLVRFINFLTSFGIVMLIFALLYKFLPDIKVRWRPVWGGALLSSMLFVGGKSLIGIYIAHSNFYSLYGAGGSFLVLLCWVYYSALIFYFGAEFVNVMSGGTLLGDLPAQSDSSN